MRRMYRAVPMTALAFTLVAVLAVPAAAQQRLPDLTVESAAEPPDFVPRDGDFLATFTVGNQGRRSSGQTTLARAYLSVGRVLSADDRRRRVGDRRVRALRAGRSTTRRMVVEIPAQFQQGEYFLIVCADVRNQVNETNDRANCHVSGQRMSIADQPPGGTPGPPGPPGPRGEPGPPGEGGGSSITIPRKTLPLGTATFLGDGDPGDNEGSTQQFDLAEVGGVRVRALCRATTNGDSQLPSAGAQDTGGYGNYDEDGHEAKILLYYDRSDGNFSFDGDHGSRRNVEAGFGRVADPDGEETDPKSGGEGQHQFLATARDPEAVDEGADSDFDAEPDYQYAYRSTGGFVSTSGGTDFILNVFAGIDVLNVGEDRCVFGGSITRVNG